MGVGRLPAGSDRLARVRDGHKAAGRRSVTSPAPAVRPGHREPNTRLRLALVVLAALGAVGVLSVPALDDSIVYYRTPTELLRLEETGKRVRVGGLVEPGSVVERDGLLTFTIIDDTSRIRVRYSGRAPGVFQAGQDTLVEGTLGTTGMFHGEHIMVKHAETYRGPGGREAPPTRGRGGG
ncbi:MAG: hypothetical protein GEU97_14945 [Actinophytocola sp.]|nr:hypothetical protein [Actinophytocola sp.]